MDLIPIGQAAAQLGLSPSALRYYDERGLVRPPARRAGQRMYGSEELRRLAFVKIAHRLGLPLNTAAAVLDAPGPQWRRTVREQIAALDEVITQAQEAQLFLTHALNCPTQHPARECATMIAALDRLVGGTTVDQLAAEHPVPPLRPHRCCAPFDSALGSNLGDPFHAGRTYPAGYRPVRRSCFDQTFAPPPGGCCGCLVGIAETAAVAMSSAAKPSSAGVRVAAAARAPTSSGPPASPSSRPTSAAPRV
jgi:DNA-binding transcriptional MerR regulator